MDLCYDVALLFKGKSRRKMSVVLTVCDTCKLAGWDAARDPKTDGEKLAEMVEKLADDVAEVEVRRHSCLMGCDFGCNISIQNAGQSPEKLTYVLGKFEPDEDAAAGIVEFASKFGASETGQVPFKEWPQAIKGHFRARIPPAPKAE